MKGLRVMSNCRERCPYRKICKEIFPQFNGDEETKHYECPMAWKIEDLLNDYEPVKEDE